MTIRTAALIAAALFGTTLVAAQPAAAFTLGSGLRAPSSLQDVACRVVRQRTVLPGGRVVVRSVRTCSGPIVRPPPRCTVVRERIVRPGGRVIFKSTRRCG